MPLAVHPLRLTFHQKMFSFFLNFGLPFLNIHGIDVYWPTSMHTVYEKYVTTIHKYISWCEMIMHRDKICLQFSQCILLNIRNMEMVDIFAKRCILSRKIFPYFYHCFLLFIFLAFYIWNLYIKLPVIKQLVWKIVDSVKNWQYCQPYETCQVI